MSREHRWAALNLEMPPRVPRTEYSAESHWDLVRAVTGMAAGPGFFLAVGNHIPANTPCITARSTRK